MQISQSVLGKDVRYAPAVKIVIGVSHHASHELSEDGGADFFHGEEEEFVGFEDYGRGGHVVVMVDGVAGEEAKGDVFGCCRCLVGRAGSMLLVRVAMAVGED